MTLTLKILGLKNKMARFGRETPPMINPPISSKTYLKSCDMSLAERVKQLVIYAETPEEVEVLAEAYAKLYKK